MRHVTAGESHGPALVSIISDVPAGLSIGGDVIDADLARRQVGYGRGGRMAIERDTVRILSGVRHARALGTPVTLLIENRDWANWTEVMAVDGERPEGVRVTAPRPGHADLSGILKTGTDDARDILERASARETAARVAAGAVAKMLLAEFGVSVRSWVERIGPASVAAPLAPCEVDQLAVEASDVRCPDDAVAAAMRSAIDDAKAQGESLGGVFCVCAEGCVPGIGHFAQPERRLDALIAGSLVSIPAIKGVAFGDGFELGERPGSAAHDEILWSQEGGFRRASNHAGGIEGGMSNGEAIVVRAVMKPIPTLMRPLHTVDIDTKAVVDASKERSDVCAVPAAAVIAEAELALVLATAYQTVFGTDTLSDIVASLEAYRERIGA